MITSRTPGSLGKGGGGGVIAHNEGRQRGVAGLWRSDPEGQAVVPGSRAGVEMAAARRRLPRLGDLHVELPPSARARLKARRSEQQVTAREEAARRRSRLRGMVKYERLMLFLLPPNGLFTCQRRPSGGRRTTLFSFSEHP